MYRAAKRFINTFRKRSTKDKRLITAIETIVGSKPLNLDLYRLATKHSSVAETNAQGLKESNERLEYLGDAILGAAVADYLFKKYPFKDEGFLTEIRSRIVNRESLNNLGKKIGLNALVEYDQTKRDRLSHKSLYGDTLEAFVGAVYLDHGYDFCRTFILEKLIMPYFDLQAVIESTINFKSKLIEWSQKENAELRFDVLGSKTNSQHKEFTAEVVVNNETMGKGYGYNKKKAEQDAAQKTLVMLGLIEN
ncbi:ribonuclease III [Fulvivirga lutimaris]|uniref:ribonuclease III n=1 Tax=Fulvivirga lutimaris TaxID=1819566 RepID=UPI00162A7D36|nr:ribonuclease III [Fulvivirga lutimaris]